MPGPARSGNFRRDPGFDLEADTYFPGTRPDAPLPPIVARIPGTSGGVFLGGPTTRPARGEADQEALKGFGDLVGDWRGVGQLKRLSNKGAWTEEAGWAWKLSNDSASLVMKVEGGKFLKSASLSPDKAKGAFRLEATLADGSTRSFSGKSAGSEVSLVLLSDGKGDGPRRITLTPRHGTRLIVLYESKDEAGEYQRLGEVGFTRKGVSFAAGDSYPECIVTGGRGDDRGEVPGEGVQGLLLRLPRPVQREPRRRGRRVRGEEEGRGEVSEATLVEPATAFDARGIAGRRPVLRPLGRQSGRRALRRPRHPRLRLRGAAIPDQPAAAGGDREGLGREVDGRSAALGLAGAQRDPLRLPDRHVQLGDEPQPGGAVVDLDQCPPVDRRASVVARVRRAPWHEGNVRSGLGDAGNPRPFRRQAPPRRRSPGRPRPRPLRADFRRPDDRPEGDFPKNPAGDPAVFPGNGRRADLPRV